MTQSSFDSFDPHGYLEEYYQGVGPENQFLLEMSVEAYRPFANDSLRIIELGGGPTIYQLIGAAACAKEIHFTDYSQASLDEVARWVRSDPSAFNWDHFFAAAGGLSDPNAVQQVLIDRSEALRSKIAKLSLLDIKTKAYSPEIGEQYDVASSFFASDGITTTTEEWKAVLANITSFTRPHGYLMMAGVFGSDQWKSGNQTYRSTRLDEQLLLSTLRGMDLRVDLFGTTGSETNGEQGYDEVFFVKAQKL